MPALHHSNLKYATNGSSTGVQKKLVPQTSSNYTKMSQAPLPRQQHQQTPLKKSFSAGSSTQSPIANTNYDLQKPPKYASYLVCFLPILYKLLLLIFCFLFQPTYEQRNIPPSTMNISMNPSYVEDFNGSDYVCMSGGSVLSNKSMNVGIQKPIANVVTSTNIAVSGPTLIGSSKHISSLTPVANEPQPVSVKQYEEKASVSPTPSQISSESEGSGKRILPR